MIEIKIGSLINVNSLRALCCDTFYKKWKSTNTEKDLQTYMSEFFSVLKLKEELINSDITYLLAHKNEDIIGYAKLNRNRSDGDIGKLKPMELQRMYVKDEYIGIGIGKKLMTKAIEIATTEKFEVMWLGVWEKNTPAVKFYQQFGFEFYGSHEFILGEDITTDLLMKKIL